LQRSRALQRAGTLQWACALERTCTLQRTSTLQRTGALKRARASQWATPCPLLLTLLILTLLLRFLLRLLLRDLWGRALLRQRLRTRPASEGDRRHQGKTLRSKCNFNHKAQPDRDGNHHCSLF
jgi:hypothetical protein